jgi:hypothetical protein
MDRFITPALVAKAKLDFQEHIDWSIATSKFNLQALCAPNELSYSATTTGKRV